MSRHRVEVGTRVNRGGGYYIVISKVNCSQCRKVIDLREVVEPTKKEVARGYYYQQVEWCDGCGHTIVHENFFRRV
jgi:transcriptional regulator CtsR